MICYKMLNTVLCAIPLALLRKDRIKKQELTLADACYVPSMVLGHLVYIITFNPHVILQNR